MLYHGSNKFIENVLIPHTSFDYKPYVYATSDIFYALVRAGVFHNDEFLIKEDYDGRNFILVELEDGALEKVFDTSGYIYELDENQFIKNIDGLPNEYISTRNCKIINTLRIENVLEDIQFFKGRFFTIIRNQDSEEYWKTVRGGKEEYLQRRKERLKKLKEKQNEI